MSFTIKYNEYIVQLEKRRGDAVKTAEETSRLLTTIQCDEDSKVVWELLFEKPQQSRWDDARQWTKKVRGTCEKIDSYITTEIQKNGGILKSIKLSESDVVDLN